MKKHIKELFKLALTGCMLFGAWIPSTGACLMFFGEHQYPDEKDYLSK